MNKKRNKRPQEFINEQFLIDYKNETDEINTFEDILNISKFTLDEQSSEEFYIIIQTLMKIYEITSNILIKKIHKKKIIKENTQNKLNKLINLLDEFSVYNYDALDKYDCSGNCTRWNIISLIFLCISNLIIIFIRNYPIGSFVPVLTQQQKNKLLDAHLIFDENCFDESITQLTLHNTLYSLCSRWNDIFYSIELEYFVLRLRIHAAQIINEAHNEKTLDAGEEYTIFEYYTKSDNNGDDDDEDEYINIMDIEEDEDDNIYIFYTIIHNI